MRFIVLQTPPLLLSTALFAIGCGARSGIPVEGEVADTDVQVADDVVHTEAAADVLSDADASVEDAAPDTSLPPSLPECQADSPSFPEGFGTLAYTTLCEEGEPCEERLLLGADCHVSLAHGPGNLRYATMRARDCQEIKVWLTSQRLVEAMRWTSPAYTACRAKPLGTLEETRIGSANFSEARSDFCEVSPFTEHRRCIRAVMARYFP